jgi:murein DD-endopeptidase MepM/ murein hydrolase activator NlpD
MGTGGGGGIFSRKSELVADLTSAFKTLNAELEKTKKLSEDISKNIKGSFPGGGAGNLLGSSFGTSTGTKTTQEVNDPGGGGGPGMASRVAGFFGRNALKLAGMSIQAMPSVQEAFEQDLLRSRFGFFGGANANATQMNMARQGTTTDPLDAARASMIGATQGLMPGLKNFSSIAQSAATVSNLMPGVGVSGGMQAMAALNQGRNVNMLRMIGVNVRGSDGLQRSFEDIANDLWKNINSQKTGSSKITKQDLSLSLQPGNALSSMMDQYFGNDPVLRQGVISALYQKAGGGSFTKESIVSSGASTSAVTSRSDRNAASLNVNQALAPSILTGFEKANELLAEASNKLADAARSAGIIGDIVRNAATGKGFMDTIATSGNGAGSAFTALLAGGAGAFGAKAFGGIKNFFGGGPKGAPGATTAAAKGNFFSKGMNLVKGYGSKIAKFGAVKGAAAYAGLEVVQKFLNKADVPDDVRYFANALFDAGQGATAGALTFGPGGAIAGTAAGLLGAATNPYGDYDSETGTYGEGGGSDDVATPARGTVFPLSGKPPITSEFGKIRHLTFDNGQKSPSFGKPHGGVDFGVQEGTPVYAVMDGVVEPTGYDAPGFGHYIKTSNADGAENFFGHLSRKLVEGGSKVKAGDLVGYSGNSGSSTGPHLHFEVRKGGNKLDPMAYLSGAEANSLTAGAVPPEGGSLTLKKGAGNLIIQPMGGEGNTPASTYGTFNRSSNDAQTINYGGVTITFNMPEKSASDVKAIANEVRRVLSDDNIREKAVNR